jgi:hypothetical protein
MGTLIITFLALSGLVLWVFLACVLFIIYMKGE